jgi:hypothetical protein
MPAPDPGELREVMDAVVLLRELIEARPVVVIEDERTAGDAFFEMPDGTLYDTNDANPADFLEGWLRRVMLRGVGAD